MKIWLSTETCDVLEQGLPEEVAARIKWGPITPPYLDVPSQCLVECSPKDRAAILATAQQQFPEKLGEIKTAIQKARRSSRGSKPD
jgi:hypothetical protein